MCKIIFKVEVETLVYHSLTVSMDFNVYITDNIHGVVG